MQEKTHSLSYSGSREFASCTTPSVTPPLTPLPCSPSSQLSLVSGHSLLTGPSLTPCPCQPLPNMAPKGSHLSPSELHTEWPIRSCMICPIISPCLMPSHALQASHSGLLGVPHALQAHSGPRIFAPITPSVLNTLPIDGSAAPHLSPSPSSWSLKRHLHGEDFLRAPRKTATCLNREVCHLHFHLFFYRTPSNTPNLFIYKRIVSFGPGTPEKKNRILCFSGSPTAHPPLEQYLMTDTSTQ